MNKQTTNDKRPTHAIYQVLGENDNARWIRIGSAWEHKRDGKGLNLAFDAYPVTGRTVIREIDYDAQSERR